MRPLLALLLLAACSPSALDEPPPDLEDPTPGVPEQVPTDVTFFAMGDPQYGGGAEDKNTWQVAALNAFPGAIWPDDTPFAGEVVAEPRGVLIAGDLTQNGQDGRITPLDSDEIGAFELDYGLTGAESTLRWPVYEGYGNHDFDPDEPGDWSPFQWRSHYDENPTPAADLVAERNVDRVGLARAAGWQAGHYAWDWDWLHLVNADLFPGDEPSDVEPNSLARDPRDALDFLERDLAESVGDSGRPVLVMAHYGLDAFGQEPRWWTDEHKDAFAGVVGEVNLLGYVHGHTHATYAYEWEGIRAYNVGSPYYTEYNADGRGHFTVFRVTDEVMVVADVAWSPGGAPEWGNWREVVEL